MIGREPTTVLGQVDAAKRYAALSGPFRPMDAVAALPDVDGIDATIAIMAHLASVCDTQSADEATWLMRGPDRHWILGQLAEQGVLATAVADRREQTSVDQGTADLLDAIEGVDAFAEGVVADSATSGPPGEELQRLAIALERAGPVAPAYGHLETARARLAGSDATARRRLLLRDGFFGRAAELRRIADWIARPVSTTPLKGLFITGAPGIGKSTLLDEAVGRALDSDPARTLVRLDFDRAGLDARDWIGLTIELARQVANDVPQAASAIRDARQVAASEDLGGVRKKGDVSREQVPSALAALVRDMLERDGRTLLVVLDTMEVLRGRASTHPDRVFAWLDQLVRQGMVPLAILAAGRGNAFDEASWRIDEPIRLAGLEGPDVDRMLDRLNVPAASYADVRRVAEGNPLAVRLAARVIEKDGPQALADAKPGEGVAAGLLYRILLARIDDDEVRALAHPGLVVRRIDAAVVGEVLGPQLGMGTIPPQRAEKLFATLAEQHWLVEDDPLTGFVRHRPDIRRQMLPLLHREDPRGCARIDRAAAAWFAKRPEPWCAVEVAYHRLQGLRRSRTVPQLDPQVLRQLDADAIDELPAAAQDVVRRARGERSTQFRGVGLEPGAPLDPSATVELRGVVDKGDWLEGRYVYQQTFAVAMFDARSPDADVARAYLWRSGQWTEARRLDSERRRLGGVDIPAPDASPVVALVRLEMWAESRFGSLVTNLVHEPGLAARAAELRQRAVTTDLVTGALGFALRRTGPLTAPPPSVQQDSVGTAFATWAPSLAVTGEAVEGTSTSRRRLDSVAMLPPDFDDRGDAAIARLLAVDTPYATTIAALLQLRDGGEDRTSGAGVLAEHLASVTEGMRRIGALGTFGQRWEVALEPAGSAGRSVEQLTSLGLLAEWLGAAGLISRDTDVQLIAAAAERWRRTTAGRWSYARPPHGAGARWANAVDVTLADRISSLESAGSDAEGASLEQLGAWAMNGEAETLLAQLERRYRRLVAEQAGRPSPDVAAALLARHVPSAFVPPLAVLVSRRGGLQPVAVVARGPSTGGVPRPGSPT